MAELSLVLEIKQQNHNRSRSIHDILFLIYAKHIIPIFLFILLIVLLLPLNPG